MTARSQISELSEHVSIDATAPTSRGGYINRRQVMNMFATVVAAPTLIIPTAAEAGASRFKWDQTFAAMTKAKAAMEADSATFDPIFDACSAEVATVPHRTTTASYLNRGGFRQTFSTGDSTDMHRARTQLHGLVSYGPNMEEYIAVCREVVALDAARKAEIATIRARYDMDALIDRNEALVETYCDQVSALIVIPAPDGRALLWKLDHLFTKDGVEEDGYSSSWCPEWVNSFMADARRLLSNGRA